MNYYNKRLLIRYDPFDFPLMAFTSSYLSQPASTSVINYFPVNLHWGACKQCRMQTTAGSHGSMHAQAGGQLTNSNVVMRDHHILKTFRFFNQQWAK